RRKSYVKKSYKNTNTIISFCNFFKFSFYLNSVQILLF
ncbi:XRE family transcriptional regulator, partial [Enterococcus faecium]